MSKVLIIGCGGVASVAIHKCCQVPEVFTEICIASRTKSKCDKLAAELAPKTATKITTAQVDADKVDEVIALIRKSENPRAAKAGLMERFALSDAQAQAILDDPRMVLVNHTNKMPDDHTFTTKACGSATAVNKTLQTEAADAFLAMQAAAAKDGVTIWMQSGYRSVDYQKNLYDKKTQYFRNKGLSEAEAKKQAANIVNPPGYSEHNCGLAADLNSPEHTDLTEGFENTEAFRWLSAHAVEYGFILRYPKNAEAVTEITYEPWHWRYVGPENAALIQQSGLCFEDAVAVLQKLAAGEKITG